MGGGTDWEKGLVVRTLPSLPSSSDFARDSDGDTNDVLIQTLKAQIILKQRTYNPKLSFQAGDWAKINKKKFNSNQYKVRHFQIKKRKKINDPRNKPRAVDGASLAEFHLQRSGRFSLTRKV